MKQRNLFSFLQLQNNIYAYVPVCLIFKWFIFYPLHSLKNIVWKKEKQSPFRLSLYLKGRLIFMHFFYKCSKKKKKLSFNFLQLQNNIYTHMFRFFKNSNGLFTSFALIEKYHFEKKKKNQHFAYYYICKKNYLSYISITSVQKIFSYLVFNNCRTIYAYVQICLKFKWFIFNFCNN